MTGINRVGQKVVCIERNLKYLWCPNIGPVPEYYGEYTVGEFEEFAEIPGIHLNEFRNTTCRCFSKKIPWPIDCFRPLIDDHVKNEHVAEIIDGLNRPVKKVKEKTKEKT